MRIYSLLIALAVWANMWAIPAYKNTIKHTQKSGKELTLVLMGDEYLHYYLNLEDQKKMELKEDGDYHVIDERDMQDRVMAAERRRAASAMRRNERLDAGVQTLAAEESNFIGKKKGIVLLVDFQDIKMQGTHEQAHTSFNKMFNEVGYSEYNHIGSVHDYFLDQSYGRFDLEFDVVGPLTVANNCEYYGGNDNSGSDLRPATMVIEACKLAHEQGINFADYDWDGDGKVEQVFVIYAGYGENYGAASTTIWPHEWTLSSAYFYGDGTGRLKLDGVTINTYACSCELAGASGTYRSGIGTACHEFSHCLGYPDLYDTDYSGGQGMGAYDVMCSGSYCGYSNCGEVPCGYTAYERMVAGWLTPTILQETTTVTNMPDLGTSPTAYIIPNENFADECFLLENRQTDRWFSYYRSHVAPHGLFIYHLDYNKSVWTSNRPNDDPSHQRMTWVPADKSYGDGTSDTNGDCFPGTGKVAYFNAKEWSRYGGQWFNTEADDSYFTKHSLSNITENTSNGTVSFQFNYVSDKDRYTVTFNAGTGYCPITTWTQTSSYLEAITLPEAVIMNDEWTFAGWSEKMIIETVNEPELLEAGTSFTPTADCMLYAVYYKNNTANENGGSYVLDYSKESNLQRTGLLSLVTIKTLTYKAQDGSSWVIKSTRNKGLQLAKNKAESIKLPTCPAPITTIEVTNDKGVVISFSAADYTGYNNPVVLAQSEASKNAILDLTGKDEYTGYLFSNSGTTIVTKIVVNYGNIEPSKWASNPAVQMGEIVISKYGISTFTFPYAYIMPKGLRGGMVKAEETFLGTYTLRAYYRYHAGDVVPAGEVLVISGWEGTYPIMAIRSDELRSTPDENDLYADYIEEDGKYKTAWNGDNESDDYIKYYKLSTKNGGNIGWYWGADDGAAFNMSSPDRAYLVLPRLIATQVKSMTMFDDEEDEMMNNEANAITTIQVESSLADDATYDLSGRKITSLPQKGLYIKNGKKYLSK